MTLDIGVGLLLGVLLNNHTGIPYSWSLVIGILAALLPDLDFIIPSLIKRRILNEHREIWSSIHYPLIIIPAVSLIGFLFNPWVGLVMFLGTTMHFVHDSMGIGWGIKWLYPFKETTFCFLYRAPVKAEQGLPQKLVYRWNRREHAEIIKKYGDPTNAWFKDVYFHVNVWSIAEYSIFVLGLFVAIRH